jgi:hypothetical protein
MEHTEKNNESAFFSALFYRRGDGLGATKLLGGNTEGYINDQPHHRRHGFQELPVLNEGGASLKVYIATEIYISRLFIFSDIHVLYEAYFGYMHDILISNDWHCCR